MQIVLSAQEDQFMAAKPKNLYLALALACFLGLIAIFIIDGYMGVYDTAYITVKEREEEIGADFWLQEYNIWATPANWGEEILFRYEIDNRRFQSYSADVEVSLWHSQEQVQALISQQLEIAPFDKGQIEWVVNTAELEPVPPEQSYEYTVIIKTGELERRIILYLSTPSDLNKMPILPAR